MALSTIECKVLRNSFNKQDSFSTLLKHMRLHERSRIVERYVGEMLAEKPEGTGWEVEYFGGFWEYDIQLNDPKDGDTLRVEVKSATPRGAYGHYQWAGIKPENYDVLILVALTPTGPRYSIYTGNPNPSGKFQRTRRKVQRGHNGYTFYENKIDVEGLILPNGDEYSPWPELSSDNYEEFQSDVGEGWACILN